MPGILRKMRKMAEKVEDRPLRRAEPTAGPIAGLRKTDPVIAMIQGRRNIEGSAAAVPVGEVEVKNNFSGQPWKIR
jgi:hypothetical protein